MKKYSSLIQKTKNLAGVAALLVFTAGAQAAPLLNPTAKITCSGTLNNLSSFKQLLNATHSFPTGWYANTRLKVSHAGTTDFDTPNMNGNVSLVTPLIAGTSYQFEFFKSGDTVAHATLNVTAPACPRIKVIGTGVKVNNLTLEPTAIK